MTVKKSAAAAVAGSQEAADKETEQGFHGTKVDPTPDEHYTIAGVLAGKPVPEHSAVRNDQKELGADA